MDEEFGKRMVELRKRHKRGQVDVAKTMGIKPDKLREFEHGIRLPEPDELRRWFVAARLTDREKREISRMYARTLVDTEGHQPAYEDEETQAVSNLPVAAEDEPLYLYGLKRLPKGER